MANNIRALTQDDIKAAVRSVIVEFPAIPVELSNRIKVIEEVSEKLSKVLLGNGDPEHGLVMKVDRATNDIGAIKDDLKTRSNREWGIWAAIIVSIASSLLNLIMQSPK